jgi:hypothetical protein
MEKSGPVTIRQALIPPIIDGFLNDDSSGLPGALSPQPKVLMNGDAYLLDDLLAGFSMVKVSVNSLELVVSVSLETESVRSFTCTDTEGVFKELLTGTGNDFVIVRPDGVIWTAGSAVDIAIQSLHKALHLQIPELSS